MWLCSRDTRHTSDNRDTRQLGDGYYIDVSPHPSQVNSSSTIAVTCYEDQGLSIAIPSDIAWTRVVQGRSTEIQKQGHAYSCTPTDIGAVIEIEVTTKHPNYAQKKSTVIRFGPIVLDPVLRPEIQIALRNSIISYAVAISFGGKTKQYVLHISDSDIEIKEPRTGSNIKSTYTAIEPQFIESRSDPNSVTLVVPEENEADYSKYFGIAAHHKGISLKLKFEDRKLRDSLILSRKAFVVKRELRLLNIMQNSLESPVSNKNSVDVLLQMAAIKGFNQFLIKRKETYKDQIVLLQGQIESMREAYNNTIVHQQRDQKVLSNPAQFNSLLDSSLHSKKTWLAHSEAFQIETFEHKHVTLPVIGEVSEIKAFENESEIMYSHVYPYSAKMSRGMSNKEQPSYKQFPFNTIEENESSDKQSILNSNQMQSCDNLTNSLNPLKWDTSRDPFFRNEQIHKPRLNVENYVNSHQTIQVENTSDKFYNHLKEKDCLIQLLNAENATLKLQLNSSNTIKDAYMSRCEELHNASMQLERGQAVSLQPVDDFNQMLQRHMVESHKLGRESQRLNSLCRDAISNQILLSQLHQ